MQILPRLNEAGVAVMVITVASPAKAREVTYSHSPAQKRITIALPCSNLAFAAAVPRGRRWRRGWRAAGGAALLQSFPRRVP